MSELGLWSSYLLLHHPQGSGQKLKSGWQGHCLKWVVGTSAFKEVTSEEVKVHLEGEGH